MSEYFIVAESFAAPFFSDQSVCHVQGETPEQAVENFRAEYRHPSGLYSAAAFESADAYHKGADPLCRWLCNHELARQQATRDKSGYSYLGHEPGKFEIDGEMFNIPDPKGGMIVPTLSAGQ